MKVMALIIARGGSQRVPNKNIRPLAGRPLIAYSIEAAKRSRYVNRILVSTDNDAIAEVALKEGAEAPFRRPAEISRSHSTELQAVEHALGWLRSHESYEPDLVVLLRPTSPLRTAATIDRGVELLLGDPEAHCVRTVRLCSEHPHKMWVMERDGRRIRSFVPVEQKLPEAHTLAYQLLPTVYVQNASMDVLRPSNIWRLRSTTGTEIIPLVMDEIESIDINSELDFLLAEATMSRMGSKQEGPGRAWTEKDRS
jgi:N-acylneuraminate cytidylyltransferase